jgi:mannose-6-phosphate isomerase-like protein (cupin superfamily)
MSEKTRLSGLVKKAWGYEYIFATNELYCGKVLHFDKAGSKFSMHFHAQKDETWYITKGSFLCYTIDTNTSKTFGHLLLIGDSFRVIPLVPHQLVALESDSELIEVSTPDSVEDNYRVAPGDSQE